MWASDLHVNNDTFFVEKNMQKWTRQFPESTAPADPRTCFQKGAFHTCLLQHFWSSSRPPIHTASVQKSVAIHAKTASISKSPNSTNTDKDTRGAFTSYFGHLPPPTQSFRRTYAQRFASTNPSRNQVHPQQRFDSFPRVLHLMSLCFLDDVNSLLLLFPSCFFFVHQLRHPRAEVMSKHSKTVKVSNAFLHFFCDNLSTQERDASLPSLSSFFQ